MSVCVGLMSGTSLDGISAAVVRFAAGDANPAADVDTDIAGRAASPHPAGAGQHEYAHEHYGFSVELLAFRTMPYTATQRARLERALTAGSARDYCRLNFDLGEWLAQAAIAVIADAGVPRHEISVIGSHGHTLWHEPPHSTWQLGEAAVIAERTGVRVVSDFRVRDMAAGGQGAPLVPIADALLFAGERWRALQNIGGIGNVTVVPPRGLGRTPETPSGLAVPAMSVTSDPLDGVRAFDTGPGVAVIDGVTRTLVNDLPYDVDGRLAAAGTPIEPVLAELLAHAYFVSPPPKSTGRELFDAAYVERLIARCREARAGCTVEDIVATATALTARSIADAYRRFLPEPIEEMLISGGGARNPALVRMLADAVAPLAVTPFAERYFDGEAKEAVAFALLAYLRVRGEAGNVPRATGAIGPRVLGVLTPA